MAITLSKKKIGQHIAIAVFTLIILSPFGVFYILNFGGHYLLEIGIFAFACHLISKNKLNTFSKTIIRDKVFILTGGGLSVLLIIGTAFHGNLISAYSDFRSQIISVAVFCLIYKSLKIDQSEAESVLFFISIYSLSLYLAFLLFGLKQTEGVKYAYPAAAYLLTLLISAKRGWVVGWLLSASLITVCALTSFYRGQWILAAMSIITSLILLFYTHGPHTFRKLFFIAATISGATLIAGDYLSVALQNHLNSSESSYIHSIGKVQGLLTSFATGQLQSGDDIRVAYWRYLQENFFQLLFPSGLGYDFQIGKVQSVIGGTLTHGTTIDNFFVYLMVHGGLLGLLFIILFFLNLAVKTSRISLLFSVAVLLWYFFYFSTSASFAVDFSHGFFVAASAGLLMNARYFGENKKTKPNATHKLKPSQ